MSEPRFHYFTRGYLTACGRMNLRAFVGSDEVDCPRCLYRMRMEGVALTERQIGILAEYERRAAK